MEDIFTAAKSKLAEHDLEALEARRLERNKALREKYLAKYGFSELSNSQLHEIARAEKQLEACATCKGECPRAPYYIKPIIPALTDYCIPGEQCTYGRQKYLSRMLKRCRIPRLYADKTFNDYEVTADNERAVGYAKWLCEEKPEHGIYMNGTCGSGKTYLASLIAKRWLEDGRTVIFGDVPSLLDEIKRTFDGKGSSQEILDEYTTCDLLILDDLGAGKISEWSVGIIYQIVNARYNSGKNLVVTSNFTLDRLQKVFRTQDEYSASRIISRLKTMCTQVTLGGKDRRN